jgi:UDP-N-acetylglucosamine--N-acetylmuramyl-(pentapeptide) pyrophosphoryl-undecaprenol N-acetylglucosamine transferase
MRILFTGGGTGGHVFPLVAVIREVRKFYPEKNLELFYIGPNDDELGSILIGQEDVQVKKISSGKIRRYFSFRNVIDVLFKIPWGFVQSLFYFIKIKPKLVFSKGGSGSVPVVFCAKLFRIPIFIHESDVFPGMSNRIASKWAKRIFIAFPKTEYFDLSKTIVVGNPIRSEILDGSKEKAKEIFDLAFDKPLFLFLGGSQGAEFINDFVLRILNNLLEKFEVIHVCGDNNLNEVRAESQVVINKDLEKYYHLYPFLDEEKLKHAYRAAKFAISRAGAGSIFELAAVGLPSALVPLPGSAGEHQAKNAYAYSDAGACIVLEQQNLTPSFFMEEIDHLFSEPGKLENMKEEAIRFSKPEAAKVVARNILEYFIVS